MRPVNIEEFGCSQLELFFLIVAPLRKARKGVYSPICLALMVVDLKVISRKFLSLLNMTRAQALCIHEPTKVVIVDKNKNLMFAAF